MKTKQVFPTDEVAHIWANQRQHSARNSANNVSFNGRKIYSYSTVQAELMKGNENTVFIVDYNYSNTTAKHVSAIRQAINFKTAVYCHYPADNWAYSENFWKNIQNWVDRSLRCIEHSNKPRIRANTRIQSKQDAVNNLQKVVDFLQVFGLTIEDLKNKYDGYSTGKNLTKKFEAKATFDFLVNMVKNRQTILEGETAFLSDFNKSKDKADKQAQKAREKARKEAELKAREYLAKWLKGADIQTHWLREIPEIYLRAIPKNDATEVQTSWGARVSIKKAKLLFALIKTNNKKVLGFEIDGYTVVEVTPDYPDNKDGFIKIGCHIIKYSEIARFAKLMKW